MQSILLGLVYFLTATEHKFFKNMSDKSNKHFQVDLKQSENIQNSV